MKKSTRRYLTKFANAARWLWLLPSFRSAALATMARVIDRSTVARIVGSSTIVAVVTAIADGLAR